MQEEKPKRKDAQKYKSVAEQNGGKAIMVSLIRNPSISHRRKNA